MGEVSWEMISFYGIFLVVVVERFFLFLYDSSMRLLV